MSEEGQSLSEEYHRAHRVFTLLAALLAAWEYIGIGVPEAAKIPLADNTVRIAHPDVIPVVLLVMLLYFGVRLGVEWYQCSEECRARRAARLDIGIAYGIAVVAIAIFSIQAFSSIRVANVLNFPAAVWLIAMTSLAPAVGSLFLWILYTLGDFLLSSTKEENLDKRESLMLLYLHRGRIATIAGLLLASLVAIGICALATMSHTLPAGILWAGYVLNAVYVGGLYWLLRSLIHGNYTGQVKRNITPTHHRS